MKKFRCQIKIVKDIKHINFVSKKSNTTILFCEVSKNAEDLLSYKNYLWNTVIDLEDNLIKGQ